MSEAYVYTNEVWKCIDGMNLSINGVPEGDSGLTIRLERELLAYVREDLVKDLRYSVLQDTLAICKGVVVGDGYKSNLSLVSRNYTTTWISDDNGNATFFIDTALRNVINRVGLVGLQQLTTVLRQCI